jgi:hypothetical protein
MLVSSHGLQKKGNKIIKEAHELTNHDLNSWSVQKAPELLK